MNSVEIWAYIAVAILGLLTLFQLALIAKAPIGEYAWGGQHKVLTPKLRVSSILSIVLYIIFAWFALAKAGIVGDGQDSTLINAATWAFFGYFVLGIFMNAISKSKKERMVMVPVAALLAVCFFFLAIA